MMPNAPIWTQILSEVKGLLEGQNEYYSCDGDTTQSGFVSFTMIARLWYYKIH